MVGTKGLTPTEDILGQLRSTIVSHFSDIVAESKIAAPTWRRAIASFPRWTEGARPQFASSAWSCRASYRQTFRHPRGSGGGHRPAHEAGVFGDRLGQYAQMQTAESIKIAAANPGGLAGAGAGLGAGMAIGQTMAGAFNQQQQAPSGSSAPPPPPGAPSHSPRWSLAIDGKTYGPYTDDALKAMVSSGQVPATTQAGVPARQAGLRSRRTRLGGRATARCLPASAKA